MLCSQMSKWIYDTDSGVYIFITSSMAWLLLADGTKQSFGVTGSVNIMNKESILALYPK